MYTFMAKFEELNKNLGPLQEIAAQMYPLIRLVYVVYIRIQYMCGGKTTHSQSGTNQVEILVHMWLLLLAIKAEQAAYIISDE